MDYQFDDVLKSIRTTSEKKELLALIDNLNADLFKGTVFAEELNKVNDNPILKTLLQNFQTNGIAFDDKDKIGDYFKHIREKLAALKIVDIIIAIEPTDETKALLKTWAESLFSSQVVFDVTIDGRIIGGAIIIYEGQYFDFSLLQKLNQLFTGDKSKISGLIKYESV